MMMIIAKKGFSNIGADLGLGSGLGSGPVPFPGFLYFFYSLGTGLEKIWYRKKSRNRSRKNLVPKKVSEPVSKTIGTEKSLGTGLEKFGTEKNSRNRSRSDFFE